ncbi:hypothetical protein NLI96_g11259 [Meripilus lineatus]|uniref:Uncharacterized protein n=1 Tax=Meripilus lineatus TaxID=2056292 RepID=A0AAD5YB30_9APHY|nr:hypothetical protein NLI96_g11259 [Physisporinus lineatus]
MVENLSHASHPSSLTPTPADNMPPMRSQASNTPIEKYSHLERRIELVKSHASFAERLISRTRKKLTPAEKAERKENCDKHHDEVNTALAKAVEVIWQQAETMRIVFSQHDTDHYFQMIIQYGYTTTSKRKVNPWNAFIYGHNKNSTQDESSDDRLQGATRISHNLHEEWQGMTAEEKFKATKDSAKELEEFRTEALLIAVRSGQDDFLQPRTFVTSDRVSSFFESVFHRTAIDFRVKLEAYLISSIQGVVANYQQDILTLEHKIADLIFQQLHKSGPFLLSCDPFLSYTELTAKPDIVNHMNYTNFASDITGRFGIICEGWLLSKFCSPSAITTCTDLDTLYHAWEMGVASFQKLTPEEYKQWSNARFQAALEQTQTRPRPQVQTTVQTGNSVIAHDALSITPTQVAAVATPLTTVPTIVVTPSTTVPAIVAAPNSSTSAPADPTLSTSILLVSGMVLVAKKTRKQCSDKGKPRGPRQRKNKAPETTA